MIMKNTLLLTICFIICTVITCESDHNYPTNIPDGEYIGTFQRQLAFGGGDTSHVSITFSSNTWTGVSDKQHYPALCHGTYSIKKDKIIFNNVCIFTADFDGTLILGGEFDFNLDDNLLKFNHNYSGSLTDAYNDCYSLKRITK